MNGNDVELAGDSISMRGRSVFSYPVRIAAFAVLLPAVVVASNQALLGLASSDSLKTAFFPWLIFSAGSLSWCAGRFLQPVWLGWFVFVWCCALLDLLTIVICYGFLDKHYAFGLVCAQVGFLAVW